MTRDEQDILDHLRFCGWSTPLDLCAGIVVPHIRVTAALRNLSRQGRVVQDGLYWSLQGSDAGPVPNNGAPAPPLPEATQAQPVAPLPPRSVRASKLLMRIPPPPTKRKLDYVAAVEADPDIRPSDWRIMPRQTAQHQDMVVAAVAGGATDRQAIMLATGLAVYQAWPALKASVECGRLVRVARGVYRLGGQHGRDDEQRSA